MKLEADQHCTVSRSDAKLEKLCIDDDNNGGGYDRKREKTIGKSNSQFLNISKIHKKEKKTLIL